MNFGCARPSTKNSDTKNCSARYGERWSDDVGRVAEYLAGKSVVLIGGKQRPHVRDALIEAFRLEDLIWVETSRGNSYKEFETYVARPDAAVVLLAIRWSSHSYGNVQKFCDVYGKPLVRLPGGYSPNQVAAQILEQASERL